MSVDPFSRRVTQEFGVPTPFGPHPGLDFDLRNEEVGLPFDVQIEQEGQLDAGVGGNEVLAKIVGTPYEVILAHLSKFRRRAGDVVKAGQDIAESGSSGVATGPHLHLQVLDDRRPGQLWADKSVDPRAVLSEVKTMQSIGGGDPGGGAQHLGGNCYQVYEERGLVTYCLDPNGTPIEQGTPSADLGKIGQDAAGAAKQIGDAAASLNPLNGVAAAIANAQQALGEAVPKYVVVGALIGAIGLLAFGGVKRIAD